MMAFVSSRWYSSGDQGPVKVVATGPGTHVTEFSVPAHSTETHAPILFELTVGTTYRFHATYKGHQWVSE